MSQQAPQRNDDQNILAVTVLFGIVIALLFVVFASQPVPQAAPTPTPEPTVVAVAPTPETVAEATAESAAPSGDGQPVSYTADQVAAGQRIFGGLCFACHGQGGVGITGLGKPLVGSAFVNGLTDAELVAFLNVGRQPTDPLNTTGQLMPPKGGNPALTDEDLHNIVAYIRSLNGATVEGGAAAPEVPANATPTEVRRPSNASNWTPPVLGGSSSEATATVEPTAAPIVEATAEATTEATTGAAADESARLFAVYCASCHGAAGEGVGGQAVLAGQTFDWDAFVKQITVPAPVGTIPTGFVHPFRGGVPTLTDEQIAAIIAFSQGLGN